MSKIKDGFFNNVVHSTINVEGYNSSLSVPTDKCDFNFTGRDIILWTKKIYLARNLHYWYTIPFQYTMSSTQNFSNLAYTQKDLTLLLKSDNDNDSGQHKCSSASTNESSPFDLLLTSLWEDAMSKDLFRYKLTKNSLQFKALSGRFNYIAQVGY